MPPGERVGAFEQVIQARGGLQGAQAARALDNAQVAASANHINADDIWKGRLAAVRMGKGACAVHAGFFRRAEQISHR